MMAEIRLTTVDGWRGDEGHLGSQLAESTDELFFAQFLELFCRVASAFHHEALRREGAQLRRAIETCRLEFSIELLLQQMNITLLRDEGHRAIESPVTPLESIDIAPDQNGGSLLKSAEGPTASISSEREEQVSRSTTVRDITSLLASTGIRKQSIRLSKGHQQKRSVLFSRLPPRRSSSTKTASSNGEHSDASFASQHPTSRPLFENLTSRKVISPRPIPPRVVMIREIVSPPPMSKCMLHLVESAIKYQNAGQYHVRRSCSMFFWCDNITKHFLSRWLCQL